MFGIGDCVIKPNNGVCRIVEITHPDFLGSDNDKLFYRLEPADGRAGNLFVSLAQADTSMRKIMSEEDAWKLIKRIPDIDAVWIENDKMREQIYKDALKSCDPEQLVGIIKNMFLRKKDRLEKGKKSTAVDDRYFKLAEDTLYAELAFAIGREREDMSDLIRETIEEKA